MTQSNIPSAPRRALVVIDVQMEYFSGGLLIEHPPVTQSLPNIARAMDAARAAGIPVVVVQHSESPAAPLFAKGSASWALHEAVASIIGSADKATVQNWYLGNQYHVEQIKSGDGKVLQDTQVDKLVQAMAAFTPPAMGQTSLTAAQQTALAPVLAANWH